MFEIDGDVVEAYALTIFRQRDVCYHRNGHVFKDKDLRMLKKNGALIPLMTMIGWIDLLIQRMKVVEHMPTWTWNIHRLKEKVSPSNE
nr:hypothetical protein [Tanacetum cinerariifolium]